MFNNVIKAITAHETQVLDAHYAPQKREEVTKEIFQELQWSMEGIATILIPIRSWIIDREIRHFINNEKASKINELIQLSKNIASSNEYSKAQTFNILRSNESLKIFNNLDLFLHVQNPIFLKSDLTNTESWNHIKNAGKQEVKRLIHLLTLPLHELALQDKKTLLELYKFFQSFKDGKVRFIPSHGINLLEAFETSHLKNCLNELLIFEKKLNDCLRNKQEVFHKLMQNHKITAETEVKARRVERPGIGLFSEVCLFDKLTQENASNRLFRFVDSPNNTWKYFDKDQKGTEELVDHLLSSPYGKHCRILQQLMSQYPLTDILSIFHPTQIESNLFLGDGTVYTEVSHKGDTIFIKRACQLSIKESMSMDAPEIGQIDIQVEFAIEKGIPSVKDVAIGNVTFL